jgi:ABC-type sugar transport system ATPase subunit
MSPTRPGVGLSSDSLEHISNRFGKMIAMDVVMIEREDESFFALLGFLSCVKAARLQLMAGLRTLTLENTRTRNSVVDDLSSRKGWSED